MLGFKGLLVGLTWEVEYLHVAVFLFGYEPNTGTQVLAQIHVQPVRVKRSCIYGGWISEYTERPTRSGEECCTLAR